MEIGNSGILCYFIPSQSNIVTGGTDNISVILVALHEAFSDEYGLSPSESQEMEADDSNE